MTTSVTGIGSLNYTGVGSPNPPNLVILKRAPNSNDSQNVTLGTLWLFLTDATEELWILVSLAGNTATWVQLYPGAGGGATQFVTDAGTANEVGGVLNVVGGTGVSTAGVGNTVTVTQSAAVADSFPTDSGTAVPVAGALTVHGGSNINTSGSVSTVTVNLDNNVTIGSSLTLPTFPGVLQSSNAGVVSASRGTNGQLLIGHTGVNPIWTNLSSSDGSVVITNGAGTINLAVTGSDAASFVTDSGTATPLSGALNINGQDLLATSGSSNTVDISLTNGSDGQLIIGGGSDPLWANLTSSDMSIVITTGANSIDLSAVGGGGGGGNFESTFSAYQSANVLSAATQASPNYLLGAQGALTILTNVSGSFFEGDGLGTPASYTAPVSGTYYFQMKVDTFVSGVGSVNGSYVAIITPTGTFPLNPRLRAEVGGSIITYDQIEVDCVVPLNMNDVVTFQVTFPTLGGGGAGNIGGSASPFETYIGGFLIKSGSRAGSAFQAVQSANAVGVTGGSNFPNPVTYLLGQAAIMTTNFDPGANFYPGDGAGTACHYTAPSTGLYQFNYNCLMSVGGSSGGPNPIIAIVTPSDTYETYAFSRQSTSWTNQARMGSSLSCAVPLTAGDQVTFSVYTAAGSDLGATIYALQFDGTRATYISGYQIA